MNRTVFSPSRRIRLSLSVLALLFVVAGLVVLFGSHAYDDIGAGQRLQPPSASHLFGVDSYGRDYLTRVSLGVIISVTVGLVVALLAIAIGAPLGVYSAIRGGWLDMSIGRVLEVLFAFPQILLALVLITILGSGIQTAVIVLVIIYIPIVVRFVRNVALVEAQKDYVLSAQMYGAPRFRQCFVHVMPNIRGSILVLGSSICAFAMIAEATLSYLGLGVRPPLPSLGILLTENQGFLSTEPRLIFFPAVVLVVLVIAVNQIGDALVDKLDLKRNPVRA
jgi:ABC-type dipeptide/oligopeptide/nickel transport system permease subunit